MKTVVFCSNTTFAIVNFRAGAIRALTERGHRVVVVAPKDSHESAVRELGAQFEHWDLSSRSTNPFGELRALMHLMSIYRRIKPDLAFHYTIKAVLYGAIAARLARVRFVSVLTGLGYVFLHRSWISVVARWLYRGTLKWSSEIWFLNADDAQVFRQSDLLPRDTTCLVLPGEGIDLAKFRDSAPSQRSVDEGIVFLFIGRLLRDKGVVELVQAARRLKERLPRARVQLLGEADGANPTAISAAQVKAWCDEGIVEHLGVCADVRPAIANADAVVLPSYREGVPRALLEAAAMSKPVIATDVPGCREVVVDGTSGLLCKVRDAADLADRLEQFCLMSPQLRQAMGDAGRLLAEKKFDETQVVAHYLRLVC